MYTEVVLGKSDESGWHTILLDWKYTYELHVLLGFKNPTWDFIGNVSLICLKGLVQVHIVFTFNHILCHL